MTEFEYARLAATLGARIEKAGVSVDQCLDFDAVSNALLHTERQRVSPEMNPLTSDIFKDDYVSLTATTDSGTMAAHVGVRRFRLRQESYADFLFQQYRRIYANGTPPFDASDLPPVMNRIKGDVVYVGDLIIEPEWRGKIGLNDLVGAAFALSELKFHPDWTVGYISHRNMMRGLATAFGAPQCHPFAIPWATEPKTRRRSDWFLCVERDAMQYALGHLLGGVSSSAASSSA